MNKEDLTMMALFGIGVEKAKEITKEIGIGDIPTAFGLGFQNALRQLRDAGLVNTEDLDKYIESQEK